MVVTPFEHGRNFRDGIRKGAGRTGHGAGTGISAANAGKPVWTLQHIVQNLDRADIRWTSSTITYSFPSAAPAAAYGTEAAGFTPFTEAQKAATRQALQAWSDVANVTFVEQADPAAATLHFSNTTTGPLQSWAYLPGSSHGGDVWVNPLQASNGALGFGGYGRLTLIHEIGHTLGLSHPGDYDASAGVFTYDAAAPYQQDSWQYTVMSYFDASNTGAYHAGQYASTPLLDDIAAVQAIYGANTATRSGNTTYGFHSNAGRSWFDFTQDTQPVVAIWDGGGTDTLDLSGFAQGSDIDLRAGSFSSAGGLTDNIAIAYGTTIENAVGGAGNDTIIGNAAGNTLVGGSGNDSFDGLSGTDTVVFQGTHTQYHFTRSGKTITATDSIVSRDGIDTLTNVERGRFSDGLFAFKIPAGGASAAVALVPERTLSAPLLV